MFVAILNARHRGIVGRTAIMMLVAGGLGLLVGASTGTVLPDSTHAIYTYRLIGLVLAGAAAYGYGLRRSDDAR